MLRKDSTGRWRDARGRFTSPERAAHVTRTKSGRYRGPSGRFISSRRADELVRAAIEGRSVRTEYIPRDDKGRFVPVEPDMPRWIEPTVDRIEISAGDGEYHQFRQYARMVGDGEVPMPTAMKDLPEEQATWRVAISFEYDVRRRGGEVKTYHQEHESYFTGMPQDAFAEAVAAMFDGTGLEAYAASYATAIYGVMIVVERA